MWCVAAGAVIGTVVGTMRNRGALPEPLLIGDEPADTLRYTVGVWPASVAVAVVSDYGITRLMGERLHNITDDNIGIDLRCRHGEAAMALSAVDGVIEASRASDDGTMAVAVRADDGLLAIISPVVTLSDTDISIGRRVARGDTIGAVAIAPNGLCTLHLEIWNNGQPVDPHNLTQDNEYPQR